MKKEKVVKFKYKIGDIIELEKGRLLIVDAYYKEKDKKYGNKYYICNIKYYKVKCLDCGAEYEKPEDKIYTYKYCPYCINRLLLVGYNDMWTTNPEMAKMLKNPEDGYKVMRSSNKPKLEWICPYCGEVIKKTPNEVSEKGLCCPICSNTISYPNRLMYNLLRHLNVDFKNEKAFSWSNNKKYDFYIKTKKCIIEMHGIQHYEENTKFTSRTLKEEQENDIIKQKSAINNGIENYIIIDARYSDFSYIKENILHSKLSDIFDLTSIDWEQIKLKSESNLVSEAAMLWNSGEHCAKNIGEELGIKHIERLLKKASDLGLCDYNTKETQAEGRKLQIKIKYQKYAKPIFVPNTEEYFGNLTICIKVFEKRGIKLERRLIEKILNNEYGRKSHKGYNFSYITHEKFNHIKENAPEKAFGEMFDLSMDCTKTI